MKRPTRPAFEPWHRVKNLKPHPAPDTPDVSTPKFAHHGRHVEAVGRALGGKGFPFYPYAGR